MTTPNRAWFDIDLDGGDAGFTADPGDTVSFTLRDPNVQSWQLQVWDPDGYQQLGTILDNPPRKSKNAPEFDLVGATTGRIVSPALLTGPITAELPNTGNGINSWIVRSVVDGGFTNGVFDINKVHERLIVTTPLGIRKPVVTETQHFEIDSWAGVICDIIDALNGGIPSGATEGSIEAVVLASAAALPAYTRTGNVVTADANGYVGDQDGRVPVVGSRYLLRQQHAQAGADVGVYVWNAVGGGGTPYQLTRVADFDTSAEAEVGTMLWVLDGDDNAESLAVMTGPIGTTVVLNTTALEFTLYKIEGTEKFGLPDGTVGQVLVNTLGGASGWTAAGPGASGEFLGVPSSGGVPMFLELPASEGSGGSGASTRYYKEPVDYHLDLQTVDADYDDVEQTLTWNADGAFDLTLGATGGPVDAEVGQRLFLIVYNAVYDNGQLTGIWVVTQVGDVDDPTILTRADDFDESSDVGAGAIARIRYEWDVSDEQFLTTPRIVTVKTLWDDTFDNYILDDDFVLDVHVVEPAIIVMPAEVEPVAAEVLPPVHLATVEPLPAYTYNPTEMKITADDPGSLTIDGVEIDSILATVGTFFVLLKDEVDPVQNGVYFVQSQGDVGNPFELIRVDDSTAYRGFMNADLEVKHGHMTRVLYGVVNGGALATLDTPEPLVDPYVLTIDVAELTYSMFFPGTSTAGDFVGQPRTWNGTAEVWNQDGTVQLQDLAVTPDTPLQDLATFQLHEGWELVSQNVNDWTAEDEDAWAVTRTMVGGAKQEAHRFRLVKGQTTDGAQTTSLLVVVPASTGRRLTWFVRGIQSGGSHIAMRAGDVGLARKASGDTAEAWNVSHPLYRSDATWGTNTGVTLTAATHTLTLHVQGKAATTIDWRWFVGWVD